MQTRAKSDLKRVNISKLLLRRSFRNNSILMSPEKQNAENPKPTETEHQIATSSKPAKKMTEEKRFKLQPFDTGAPELWFASAEIIFAANNVNEEKSKFSHLLQNIDSSITKNIQNIILDADGQTPYTTAKKTLLDLYAESVDKKLDKLLSKVSLDTFTKPTLLLQEMRRLASGCGQAQNEQFIKSFFLRKLPPLTRAILADTENILNAEQIAKKADIIQESGVATGITPSVSAVEAPNPTADNSCFAALANAMTILTAEVAALKTSRSRDRSSSPEHYRSRSRSRNYQRHYRNNRSGERRYRSKTPNRHTEIIEEKCWYHDKYGTKAHRCQVGCKYFSSDSGND